MICFIKIHHLPTDVEEILSNQLLTFPMSNVATTGEILNRSQVAHHKNLQFKVRSENVSLAGSLHIHFEGGTNHRDFGLADIQETVKNLSETYNFDPKRAFINFIEIGVNISVWCDPSQLIKTIVLYRNKAFERLPVKGKGFGYVCKNQQFDIKIYDKSLQYGLSNHILRYEIKVRRMKFLERYGITNLVLADLTKPDLYTTFKHILLDIWSGILIFDMNIKLDKIDCLKYRELCLQGRYPQYWIDLDRYKRHRNMKKFKILMDSEVVKHRISDLIERKCNELTTFKKVNEFEIVQQNNHFQKTTSCFKTQLNNTTIKCNSVSTCIVTGLEIHTQHPKTNYLTAKGVEWYFNKQPKIYSEKLENLLTDKWKIKNRGEPKKIWFDEIAHKIRCKLSNPRRNPINNTKKSFRNIESKGFKLWSTEELADPEKFKLIRC